MSKRLRHSRFRRLPGIYRFGERKPPDPGDEPQRITLYLPDRLLEQAEAQARRSGFETVQEYCEDLLGQAIEVKHDREVVEESEARRGTLEGLDAIANDPEYLAEWKASASPRQAPDRPMPEEPSIQGEALTPIDPTPDPDPEPRAEAVEEPAGSIPAVEVILRHAAIRGDDPSAFLATLRRGEPIEAGTARELLGALAELEASYRQASRLDRLVAYALHRLAFEGQILLTDAWPGAPIDEATVDVLRIVQEAVDRVLSGQDIRYFAPGAGPEGQP